MSEEIVELRHPGSGDLLGRAKISNLPDHRFPADLEDLAPIIRVDSKLYRLHTTGDGGFGPKQTAIYFPVEPRDAEVVT